jgi:3-isopropylmalate dehydrogenase
VVVGRTYKVSVLPGDGIGKEVVPEAIRVLKAAEAVQGGLVLEFSTFPGGGEYYLRTGTEWSEEAERFTKHEADAVVLGAVGANDNDGNPVRRPDNHLAGYSLVIGLRRELDLFANLRPVKLYEGVPNVLASKSPGQIDMVMVRENTEGLYAPQKDEYQRGDLIETAIDHRIITRSASKRVARFAFEQATQRKGAPTDGKSRVTCVDKSNLLAGCQLFRKSFDEVAKEYPRIERDYAYVDAFTQWIIRKPEWYDVVVAPNCFGDIITDLGAALQGGLGLAPAANIGTHHGVFEPVHGSAPKHAGKNVSNPMAAVLAAGMMLQWLGTQYSDKNCREASTTISTAVQEVIRNGKIRTYDLCEGEWASVKPSSTTQVTDAIIRSIQESHR